MCRVQDVAGFLLEFKAADILLGMIAKSRCPRLTVSDPFSVFAFLCKNVLFCNITCHI